MSPSTALAKIPAETTPVTKIGLDTATQQLQRAICMLKIHRRLLLVSMRRICWPRIIRTLTEGKLEATVRKGFKAVGAIAQAFALPHRNMGGLK
jgi:hypothetical protein